MNTYNRYDLEIVEGMGVNAYDVEGKEYIDLSAGIGVNSRLLRNGLGGKRNRATLQTQSREQFVLFTT